MHEPRVNEVDTLPSSLGGCSREVFGPHIQRSPCVGLKVVCGLLRQGVMPADIHPLGFDNFHAALACRCQRCANAQAAGYPCVMMDLVRIARPPGAAPPRTGRTMVTSRRFPAAARAAFAFTAVGLVTRCEPPNAALRCAPSLDAPPAFRRGRLGCARIPIAALAGCNIADFVVWKA